MRLFFLSMLFILAALLVAFNAFAQTSSCAVEDKLTALATDAPVGSVIVIEKNADSTFTTRVVVPPKIDADRAENEAATILEALSQLKPISKTAIGVVADPVTP